MEGLFGYLAVAALLGLIAGEIARRKGQSFFFYWFLGFVFLPLGLILAVIAAPNPEGLARAEGLRKCPHCAELVKGEATICRYCQQPLPEIAATPAPSAPTGRFRSKDEYERWRAEQAKKTR